MRRRSPVTALRRRDTAPGDGKDRRFARFGRRGRTGTGGSDDGPESLEQVSKRPVRGRSRKETTESNGRRRLLRSKRRRGQSDRVGIGTRMVRTGRRGRTWVAALPGRTAEWLTAVPPRRWLGHLLVGGLVGGFLAGWAGLAIGAAVGLLSGRAPKLLPLASASAVIAVAVATMIQGSFADGEIPRFALDRPVAHVLGLGLVLIWLGSVVATAPAEGASLVVSPVAVPSDHQPKRSPVALIALVGLFAGGAAAIAPGGLEPQTVLVGAVIAVGVVLGAAALFRRLGIGPALDRRVGAPLAALADRRGEAGLVTGSTWMLGGTIAVSLGSFVFWVLAARTAGADAVGQAAALFTAVFFLTYATSMGLPIATSRFAARPTEDQTSLFGLFLVTTTATSAVGVTAFVLLAPDDLMAPLRPWGDPGAWLLMFGLVTGVSISVLVDVRLMGRRRWHWVFWRSVAISLLRIAPFLFIGTSEDGLALFIIATSAYALTALVLLPSVLRTPEGWPHLRSTRIPGEVVRYSGVNYLGQLAVQAPFYVTPMLVLLVVPSDENAEFYLSWGIMSVVFIGVQVIGQALLVEGSRPDSNRIQQVRTALLVGLTITTLATLACWIGAGLTTRIYGEEFREVQYILPLLMTGTIPWAVTTVALADARIRKATRTTLVVTVSFAALVVGAVAVGVMAGGVRGAAAGWLIGNVASVIISSFVVFRTLRSVETMPKETP